MDSNKKESLEEFLNSSVSSLDYLIDERTNLVEERSNQFVVSNSLELASSSDSSLIEDNPTLSTIQESFQESIQNTERIDACGNIVGNIPIQKRTRTISSDEEMYVPNSQNQENLNQENNSYPLVNTDEDYNGDLCCICLEDMIGEIAILKCGHQFHFNCIVEWINKKKQINVECPYCYQPTEVMNVYWNESVISSYVKDPKEREMDRSISSSTSSTDNSNSNGSSHNFPIRNNFVNPIFNQNPNQNPNQNTDNSHRERILSGDYFEVDGSVMNLSLQQIHQFNRDYSDPRSPFNNIGMYSAQTQNIPINITNYSYGTIAVPVNHSGLSYQTSYYEEVNRQNRQNNQYSQNESYNQNRPNIQQYSLSSNTRNERNSSRRNNKCFDCCVIS